MSLVFGKRYLLRSEVFLVNLIFLNFYITKQLKDVSTVLRIKKYSFAFLALLYLQN
jgi:hypothetical protein